MVVFGQGCCNLAKVVVLRQVPGSWANFAIIGQIGSFEQNSFIRAKRLYLSKVVVFGQKWLYLGKMLVFGQSGCILAKWLYLSKSGCIWARMMYLGKSGCY